MKHDPHQRMLNFGDSDNDLSLSNNEVIAAKKWDEVNEYFSKLLKRPESNSIPALSGLVEKLIEATKSGAAHYDLTEIVNFISCNVEGQGLKEHPISSYVSPLYDKIFFYSKHKEHFNPSPAHTDFVKNRVENLLVLKNNLNAEFSKHQNSQAVFDFIDRSIDEGNEFLSDYVKAG